MTWPLARDARGALPSDLGDPLLNTFLLAWDADRIRHGLVGLWNAPLFFPVSDALALSEHLLGIAVFTAPLQWISGNPVLVYNVAFLASYVLAGTAMYALVFALWKRRDAALIAALAFAFAPHRVLHVSHLQVLMSGWMPLCLLGWHRYFATGSRRALVLAAGSFALLGLSNGYYLYFFALPVVLVVADGLWWRVREGSPQSALTVRRAVFDLTLAAVAVGAIFAPIAAAYLRMRAALGMHRPLGELRGLSAVTADYLKVPPAIALWASRLPDGGAERSLFPGALVVVLAAGAFVAWAARCGARGEHASAGANGDNRSAVPLYATMGALAFWLSLGPFAPGPYLALIDGIPGFGALRVPARFAVVVALALAVLAGAGAAWLLKRVSRMAALAVTVLLSCTIMLEGYGGPMHMQPFDPSQPGRRPINAWLAIGPPGGVLELPISVEQASAATLPFQFSTLSHGHHTVNGYSGYDSVLQRLLGGPGTPLKGSAVDIADVILGLRSIGVRYVVLNEVVFQQQAAWWTPDAADIIATLARSTDQVVQAKHENRIWVWQLASAPSGVASSPRPLTALMTNAFTASASSEPHDIRFAFDRSLATWWSTAVKQSGDEWIRLAFDRDRDVAAVDLDMGRERVREFPRRLRIESEDVSGVRRSLFDGSVVTRLIAGIAQDGRSSRARIELPSNRSHVIWIRQVGQHDAMPWTIAEMTLWER
jgi:hypothetical protein